MHNRFARLVYLNAFVIGFVIMAFEMVASRYMTPFFGGAITTWAALISTVLLALMTGYFCGGSLSERVQRLSVMGGVIIAAAFYIACVPLATQGGFEGLSKIVPDDTAALLISSVALLFVPIALLGAFTPYSLRLLVGTAEESGKVAGKIYSVSTLGNIAGTLLTPFYLIPHMGSVSLTFLLAGVAFLSGMSLCVFSSEKGK